MDFGKYSKDSQQKIGKNKTEFRITKYLSIGNVRMC